MAGGIYIHSPIPHLGVNYILIFFVNLSKTQSSVGALFAAVAAAAAAAAAAVALPLIEDCLRSCLLNDSFCEEYLSVAVQTYAFRSVALAQW